MGCVSVTFHDYAKTDYIQAAHHINQIKDDTILVALTTYKDKADILKGAIENGSKDIEKNKRRLNKLISERTRENLYTINAFETEFSFATVLYIPDSLIHSYENGDEGVFFVNTSGHLDSTIKYNNRSPIKIIQLDDIEWNVVQKNTVLPNPFPNRYAYKNGLATFLGLASPQRIVKDVARTFQLRFEKYYNNPTRRVRL